MMRSSTACSRIRSSGGEMVSSVFFFASRAKAGAARTSPPTVESCKRRRRPEILSMARSFSDSKGNERQGPVVASIGAELPAHFPGQRLEEIDVVGSLRRLAYQPVDLFGVLADQDAPALGLDAVEDDLGGFGGGRRRILEEAPRSLMGSLGDVLVGQIGDVDAHRGDASPYLRDLR